MKYISAKMYIGYTSVEKLSWKLDVQYIMVIPRKFGVNKCVSFSISKLFYSI